MTKSSSASRKSAAPRERIVAGARKHFLTHGFRSVTMDDLAEELGMSKKTLYAHFPSKTTLVEAVVTAKLDQAERELTAAATDPAANLSIRLHRVLACQRAHAAELHPAFVRDVAREAPELFERVRKRRRGMIQRIFGGLLREGRAAGMIRPDVPERLMIEFLCGATDAVMNPPTLDELGLTPTAAFRDILTLFLDGARAAKKRKKP